MDSFNFSGNSPTLAAALEYSAKGIKVLPLHSPLSNGNCSCGKASCNSIGKHPCTRHGKDDASMDSEKIKTWFSVEPDTNIGLLTGKESGFIVLDIDPRNGGDALLMELEEKHGALPKSLRAKTGGGGQHILFKYPHAITSMKGKLGNGLDIKSDGGYIVAAPSRHASGAAYEWLTKFDLSLLEEAPKWLLDLLQKRKSQPAHRSTSTLNSVPTGSRNSHLFSFACHLREAGKDFDTIAAELNIENQARCTPPLGEDEVEEVANSSMRYPAGNILLDAHFTDLGNGKRFAELHRDSTRYVASEERWVFWTGVKWQAATKADLQRKWEEVIEATHREIKSHSVDEVELIPRLKNLRKLESINKMTAMIEAARAPLAIDRQKFDADADVLNVENGIVDLRTGNLCERDSGQYHTKVAGAPFLESAGQTKWLNFLNEIFGNDRTLIEFIQTAVGYTLTGRTSEHVVFILHGTGANGKSTFLEIMRTLLGDYGSQANMSAFTESRYEKPIRNDIARLEGARFVAASEIKSGARLDEQLIKSITGGDRMTARFLYKEEFEFVPRFKLWMAVNQKPEIDGNDEAIWRRVRLIPFDVTIAKENRDKALLEKLKFELPGILRWAVDGAVKWYQGGLGESDAVKRATASYRQEEDKVSEFISERCEVGPEDAFKVQSDALYKAFRTWHELRFIGESIISMKQFSPKVAALGYRKAKHSEVYFFGLRLKGTTGY